MLDSLTLVFQYVVSTSFLHAAGMTLSITIVSCICGMLVGLALALVQQSTFPGANAIAKAYLWLFRGTPVLFQIIFVFNVLPSFGIVLSGFVSGVLALSLNEGAYMAEIFRSGLQAVTQGQRTAGRSLGMRDWQVMRYIVLPQALRVIIPPAGNQFIGMLKLSALVSVIAVQDLLLVANQVASANFRYLEALAAAGLYYLALTTVFMLIQAKVESAFSRRTGQSHKTLTQRLLGVGTATPSVR